MSDFHRDLMKQLDAGNRVTFVKADGGINVYQCHVRDKETDNHLATGCGGNPLSSLFDAESRMLWMKMWPDAPTPGEYPLDVKAAMDRGDYDYARSRRAS